MEVPKQKQKRAPLKVDSKFVEEITGKSSVLPVTVSNNEEKIIESQPKQRVSILETINTNNGKDDGSSDEDTEKLFQEFLKNRKGKKEIEEVIPKGRKPKNANRTTVREINKFNKSNYVDNLKIDETLIPQGVVKTRGILRIYMRCSTDLQEQSIETQEALLGPYVKQKGWDVKVYIDEGISGSKNWDERPGLKRLLKEDLRPGDEVLCISQSRLSRETTHYYVIKYKIEKRGATLVCLDNKGDTTGYTEAVNSVSNKRDREETSKRVKLRMRVMGSQGLLRGRPPFGYKFIGKDLPYQPDPNEQKIIEFIRKIKDENPGATLTQICETLDANNIKIRKCKKAYTTVVKRIMVQNSIIPPTTIFGINEPSEQIRSELISEV